MAKGSKNCGNSTPKTVATIGYMSAVPVKTTVAIAKGSKNSGNFTPKAVATIGYMSAAPVKTTVTMAKGSKNSGNSTTKAVATIGYMSAVPVKTTVTIKGGGGGEGIYETKSRVSYGKKQSGSYGREMKKEKVSAGEFQRKNGTSGTKIEYQKSSMVRIGNNSGYTEVYNEQRVRNVSYNKSSGSKNLINYNNGGNGDHYGCYYGYDSDY